LGCHPVAVHIYTQIIHKTTQIPTNVEECGSCPAFASFTLAFALQLGKKHEKTSVRVMKNLRQVKKNLSQSTVCILPKHPHITKPARAHTHAHTHTLTHTHTHTLQNNIKPPQYKLKQTQCKIYPNEIVTI
jgi:hypothetical protein